MRYSTNFDAISESPDPEKQRSTAVIAFDALRRQVPKSYDDSAQITPHRTSRSNYHAIIKGDNKTKAKETWKGPPVWTELEMA